MPKRSKTFKNARKPKTFENVHKVKSCFPQPPSRRPLRRPPPRRDRGHACALLRPQPLPRPLLRLQFRHYIFRHYMSGPLNEVTSEDKESLKTFDVQNEGVSKEGQFPLDSSQKTCGRVYFVSVDCNSIMGLTTETFSQKVSIRAAVTAATGALRAASLGTAARGSAPRWRRPHKLKIFEI